MGGSLFAQPVKDARKGATLPFAFVYYIRSGQTHHVEKDLPAGCACVMILEKTHGASFLLPA